MSAVQGALSAAERSMRSVFVGNIPYEATEEQLKDIFAEVGPVVSFRLVYDRETGKPKGYGFCEYKDQEMALSAMRNLNSYELNGRALRVDNAASEKSKEELKNLQASLGGPPVESPYGADVPPEKAPEAISKVMCSLPPEQLYELMIQMKSCIENNPNETRNLLLQNPQLAYALLQAQVIMKIIDTDTAKNMLHGPGFQPPPTGALLPTPNKVEPPSNAVPPVANDGGNFPAAMPPNQMPLNQMPNNRPTQPVPPLTRPALLGERPGLGQERQAHGSVPQNPMMPPFKERAPFAQPRMPTGPQQTRWSQSGDHDLRPLPMSDRDMRGPPMMGGDKDMRHAPVGDQDLRSMNFDPRFREGPMMGGGGAPMMERGRMGGPFEGPRGDDPRATGPQGPMVGPRGPQNPRIAAVGGGSPAIGGASPNPGASPRMNNPLAAAAAAIAPNDHEKANLIMQVLQLSDQQIAMLPLEQRNSIMVLKEQIARTQQM